MGASREPIEILQAGLSATRVLVVGDLILDQTYAGSVERISPEAPIPVVKVESRSEGLGGAGNVAHNLSRLGCRVVLAGAVGRDEEGALLKSLLARKGIECDSLIETDRPTTRKVRIVSGRQQMIRLDFERAEPIESGREEELFAGMGRSLEKGVGAVVLSDYGKGVCTSGLCRRVIEFCRKRKIPVAVDPKGPDWDRYRGCTLVTPNLKELGEAARRNIPNEDREIEDAARELLARFGVDNILVTRSDRGMTLVSGERVTHEKALAKEVFDVSGAGDTVVAVVAAFLASGASLADAAIAANRAAGFVVGKAGTYAIGREELLAELRKDPFSDSLSKVVPLEQAQSQVRAWKADGKRVVFTNGCFDVLHAGHVYCLEKARALGDRLVVGLNSDSSIRRIKGPDRPVNAEPFRAKLVAALSPVDLVVVFEEETPLNLIQALEPDVLVKGGDYQAEGIVGAAETVSRGGKVVVIPRFGDLSTTGILRSFSGKRERME